MGGKDRSNWEPPGPEDPVDTELLKDHANIIKTCHSCGSAVWDYSATGEPVISRTKFEGPPGNREPVQGFFICQTCPPPTVLGRDGKPRPKLGRKGEPIPYRKAWCVKCLKFCIPGLLPSTFAFSDAFTPRADKSWAQNPLPCWHCSTSPTNACHSTCPRNPLLDARALKRPSETVLKPRPSKRSSPPPAPALSAADDVIRRETLAAAVKERKLYTPKPAAFTFFLPDFKVQKDGTIQLVEPNLDKRQFPKLVSLGCATTTNGSGKLRCNSCSDPDCLHVSILKRLVDVGRCDPPKSTRELFQPKSSPLQLSKAGFRCPGADFWAVLKDKHWVLCGRKDDGTWVCQQSRCKNDDKAKCAHVCALSTKDTYTPPGLTRRYTRDPEIEWRDIPAESPPPVKSEPKSVTVCDLCRPQHADSIKTDEFHGCRHPGRTVHMCTKACATFPCSPIPKSQLSDEGGPVNLLLQGRMQEKSATGYFSESPPTCKEAPCGHLWLRGTEEASFYTEADSSKVDLCVWRCAGKCCYLQPSFEEIYFQAPSPLRVSHKVLKEETKLIYKGTTFKLIAERGEDVGVLRPGREPPLKKDALCTWFQKYLRTELANAPLPKLRQPPGPNEWTPALRELLRERPVLPLEPADPQSLIGRTFWKLYPELHQWWRGRVTGHYVLQTKTRKGETREELFPMYKVEYPGYKECKNKYEEMTWRDLRNRLNPPEEVEGPDFWKPRPRDSPPPPGWYDEPLPPPPPPANLQNHHQKPWATCPTCQDHPEAIYIDCREAHMKRIYRDPHTGAVVNVLPITYPFPNRVVTTDVNPDGSECCCHTTAKPRNNSSIAGAPKVVAGAQMQGLRGLLTRWSGHIPVKEKYDKGQLVPIPIDDAKPAPLTTDERQKLRGLPPCVYTLVEYVDKSNKATCPNPAFTPLFYHLGYLHSDMSLLRHGAQETIVQLLATLKLSGGAPHIEIDCEWDQTLHTYAPLLQGVLFSGKGGDQRFKGFHRTEGIQGQRRRGTGYKVESALLYALAPLLQHLLRLSFHGTDYIACHEASARLCEALGVGRGEIWLGCLPENRAAKRAGEAVDPARVWDLVSTIRDLMAGPCRATSDGVLASDAYVANQHRLSSSNVYHKVYRDVPQYAGKDEADGRCVGGEKCDKCNQEMPGGGLLPDEADREVKEKGGKGSKGGKKAKVQKPEKDDTNGVMVVTCKHRFVYYFHVLLRHESLRDVFTFLCTRFEHRPPRYCIYDNACELSRYCEGRWPEFFARTMFLTDIFHGINHKCSDEFKYHAHRLDQGREFQGLRNTSVSEQINSLMKRFDRTGAASTITNGILLYEYFAHKHNADLRNEWLQAQRQQGHVVNGE